MGQRSKKCAGLGRRGILLPRATPPETCPSLASTRGRRRALALLFLLAVWAANSSTLAGPPPGPPLLLAHRGLGQTFPAEGLTAQTNTAARIHPVEHPFLENTIPAMEAAFAAGADMVELDVQPTRDGRFAVFHDWTLDHRTEATGVTRERTLDELRRLDVGHGYTADGGKTFPFRGKGVGLMPSLDEVLARFPGRAFLIHMKSDDPREGELLAAFLSTLPPERLAPLSVYGGDRPVAALKARLPGVRVMSKGTLKSAFFAYLAFGWTGHVPAGMRGALLALPLRYAKFLWGWPHRFERRVRDAGSVFLLVAGDGAWSEGFDDAARLADLPEGYAGGIWTNRIDRVAPLLKGTGKPGGGTN